MTIFEAITAQNPHEAPLRPQELIDYDALPFTKRKEIQDKFFKNEITQVYLDAKWKAELHNYNSFLHLSQYYKETEDQTEKHALIQKLTQFKRAILSTQKPYKALTIDFEKNHFEEYKENIDWSEEEEN